MNNFPWLDGALYPDVDTPDTLETLSERVDFLARLCAAWDFGLLPSADTITEIRRADWAPAVEACRLLTSPAYHLLRRWHGLSPSPGWDSRLRSFEMIPASFRCELSPHMSLSIIFLGAGTVNTGLLLYSFGFMLVVVFLGSVIFNRVEQTFMDTV